MFQYHFNPALLELNMMKWVWETSLGLSQAPTLRAASKVLENNCQLPKPKAVNTEQAGVLSAWGQ